MEFRFVLRALALNVGRECIEERLARRRRVGEPSGEGGVVALLRRHQCRIDRLLQIVEPVENRIDLRELIHLAHGGVVTAAVVRHGEDGTRVGLDSERAHERASAQRHTHRVLAGYDAGPRIGPLCKVAAPVPLYRAVDVEIPGIAVDADVVIDVRDVFAVHLMRAGDATNHAARRSRISIAGAVFCLSFW